MTTRKRVYSNNFTLQVKSKDGNSPVTYRISLAGSTFSHDPNTDTIYVNIKGKVYKTVGGVTSAYTALSRSELSMYFEKEDGSTDSVPNIDSINDGFKVTSSTFESQFYNDSGYTGEKVFVVVLTVDGHEVASESIQITKDGQKGNKGDKGDKGDKGNTGSSGSAGKMCYIAGTYDPLQTYISNASETVAVEVENSNGEVELYILEAATNVVNDVHIGPTDGRSDIWRQGLNTYNLIRAKYLFADFSQLGSFIVSQDFFMSQYGTLVGFGGAIQVTNARTAGKVYMKTVNGKRTPYYACGSSSSGDKPCYLFFDAEDPMAEDVKNGPTFTLEGKGVDDAVIVRRVWFLASEATMVEITLTPSSEANWDFGAVGALDTTVLSASGVTAETVQDGTTPTLLKASGTTALVQTVNVTAGLHFFEIAYLKDSSENHNNDKATFIFAEASNNGYISGFSMLAFRPTKLVNALTGEEWMAQGNMNVSPDGDVMVKGKLVMTSLTVQLADITLWGTSNMFVVGVDTVVGGNSIGGIWNFKCGNNQTIFLPTNRYYYLGQRVILYNSSPNLGGGNGTFVICGDIDEYGMTTEHGFRGVGLFPSYSTPPTPMQLNTYDVVTKIMFFNGILELMCVPSSQNGSTCEWCVTNIGTMFYNFYTT